MLLQQLSGNRIARGDHFIRCGDKCFDPFHVAAIDHPLQVWADQLSSTNGVTARTFCFEDLFAVAGIGVLISLYYYFGVVKAIYWSKGATDLTPISVPLPTRFALLVCIVGMLWLGLNPDGALELAVEAVKSLRLA